MNSRVLQIKQAVASQWGITVKTMAKECRVESIVFPRQVAMYLTNRIVGLNQTHIGAIFHREHTTVSHAIKRVRNRMETDRTVEKRVRGIMKQLDARRVA